VTGKYASVLQLGTSCFEVFTMLQPRRTWTFV